MPRVALCRPHRVPRRPSPVCHAACHRCRCCRCHHCCVIAGAAVVPPLLELPSAHVVVVRAAPRVAIVCAGPPVVDVCTAPPVIIACVRLSHALPVMSPTGTPPV